MQRPGDEKALAELYCDWIYCGKKLAGKQVLYIVLQSYRFVLRAVGNLSSALSRGWLAEKGEDRSRMTH